MFLYLKNQSRSQPNSKDHTSTASSLPTTTFEIHYVGSPKLDKVTYLIVSTKRSDQTPLRWWLTEAGARSKNEASSYHLGFSSWIHPHGDRVELLYIMRRLRPR